MTTPPPDKQPAAETLEDQTQKCADCGGTGKTDGYCGCPNLRSCPYCQGTGQVLTFAAREARRRRTELRYTQADIDDALRNERAARRGCEHCACTCVNCAPCGPSGEESEL